MPTLITATNRLARECQQQYDQQQIAAGLQAWPSLDVLSWSAWLKRLWHSLSPPPARLISAIEQQQIWADIIAADIARQDHQRNTQEAPLWHLPSTARQAMLAWQLLKLWDINLDRCRFSNQPDHRSFASWADQYNGLLSQRSWIDESLIVCHLAQGPRLQLPPVELHGFEVLSPAQTRLLEQLRTSGTTVSVQHISTEVPTPAPAKVQAKVYQFTSPQAEWSHIGAWARGLLQTNAQAKIGIVSPELEANRSLVISALNEQLSPGLAQSTGEQQAAFHLSVGTPLAKQPLVQAALKLIDLTGSVEFETMSVALSSAYALTQTSLADRFSLELLMRRSVAQTLDIYTALQIVNRHNPALPGLKKTFASLLELKQAAPKTQSYGKWAQYFGEWLSHCQWPGDGLNSVEFQVLEAWRKALHQLAQLDHLGKPVGLSTARSSLKQLCQQTQFQAQANNLAPIQVLGILEASELKFDYLWVAGLHDKAWPSSSQANPFIPINEQRAAGWPQADRNKHYQLAEQRLGQFLQAAPAVHFSYPTTVDEVAVEPSPLLASLLAQQTPPKALISTPAEWQAYDWYQQLSASAPTLETLNDTQAPPLAAGQQHSGLGRIQAQAACPFQAFATYRLLADFEAEPALGTDALDRGLLVHAVLADFWQNTQSQANLQELCDAEQLEAVLAPIIDQHLYQAIRQSGLGKGFAETEKKRILRLISDWLQLELARPPFSVAEQEYPMQADLSGLVCTFRIDRLDEIEAGKLAVIDYKTGLVDPKQWCSARADSPQLPLYALAISKQLKPVNAVLFAQVRPSEHRIAGIAEHPDLVSGVLPPEQMKSTTLINQDLKSWADVLPIWQQRLEGLADQHLSGDARVDPKNAASCLYCEQSSLCRIGQSREAKAEVSP